MRQCDGSAAGKSVYFWHNRIVKPLYKKKSPPHPKGFGKERKKSSKISHNPVIPEFPYFYPDKKNSFYTNPLMNTFLSFPYTDTEDTYPWHLQGHIRL